MKKVIYIYWALLLVCFCACQDDDYFSSASGEKVQLSSLSFRLSDVMSKKMVLSRADADKPTLTNLTLFIFSGGYKVSVVDIPQEQIKASAQGNEYDYVVTGAFEANTGENTVYALGNTSSAYYNSQTLLDELKKIESEDDFKKKLFAINSIYATNQSLPVSISSIFLTGEGKIQVSGTGDGAQATGEILLKRPIASIEFTVNTTATNNNNSIEFIPQTYKIYNVCQNALVISDNTFVPEVSGRQFYDTQEFTTWANKYDTDNNVIAKTCQFYLPENIQLKIDGIGEKEYSKRDERDPDTHEWKFAPKKSTYVVISGTYSEKDQNGTLVNQGTTSYTIHLGDFSNTGSMGNFSVERNARYQYNITVQGVTSIITEAKKETGDGDQPGAEGIIIGNETASEIFDLDCTYEQMIVSYDLAAIRDAINADQSDLTRNEKIANAFILKTSTPFDLSGSEYIRPYAITNNVQSDRLEQEIQIAKLMDYKWVYFYSQASSSQLSSYPGDGDNRLIDPYNLCVKLGNLVAKLLNNEDISTNDQGITVSSDNKVYFTAFVNEYYYDTDPLSGKSVNWATFTRQNDRTMTIASDMNISPDGYSIYAKARTSISQRSIQTFYNASVAGTVNAIGLETYCENSSFSDYDQYSWNQWSGKGTSDVNGRKNMIDLVGINSNSKWNNYVNIKTNGYLESSKSLSHKIENSKSLKNPHPFYACLSRNRDLNGDGNIDDNEVRWYLASGDQYARLQIGSAAMSDAAKLFQGDKTKLSTNYPDAFFEDGALYYTSTYSSSSKGDTRQMLWAAEVGAFGARKENQNYNYQGLVRCVRNLPSETIKEQQSSQTVVGDDALGDVSYDQSKGNYVFDFGDRLDPRIYRSALQYGPYAPHYEEPALDNMTDLNRLPQGFVVAKNDVNSGATYLASNIWKGYLDPCANYSQTGDDQSYRGYWRVPNLREMMVLATKASVLGITSGYYAISTGFSGNTTDRPGFSYNANSGFVTTQGGSNVKVRCVRDMINGK